MRKIYFKLFSILLSCVFIQTTYCQSYADDWTPEKIANLKEEAENGDTQAECVLGILYLDGDVIRQDYTQARKWFEKAAIKGNAVAQMNLGFMYHDGEGVRQNYQTALMWFKKSAAQRNTASLYSLGKMYLYGEGVERNPYIAKEYFGKACDDGMQEGCKTYRELNQAGY